MCSITSSLCLWLLAFYLKGVIFRLDQIGFISDIKYQTKGVSHCRRNPFLLDSKTSTASQILSTTEMALVVYTGGNSIGVGTDDIDESSTNGFHAGDRFVGLVSLDCQQC
jgi:hypothetical protein